MGKNNNRLNRHRKDVILVTGATGNVGRHVVSQLAANGYAVRALSRNSPTTPLPSEVEVVQRDLLAPDGIEGALNGIDAVFLLWRSDRIAAVSALVERLRKHARRIVFLSSSAILDDVEEQPNFVGRVHVEIERLIENSSLEWTFLRPGAFSTNSLWWWAPQIRSGDVVRWPYGRAVSAPIHERDVAAVAVRALTEDGHAEAKYVLTGPESITLIDQVRAIGDAIGRPLRFEEISSDDAWPELLAIMPSRIVDILLDVWSKSINGSAPVTSTVVEITGSVARTFRQWAIDHASDFQPILGSSLSFQPIGRNVASK
jgi:uncharacterized protein YbjT (DUF2867 family)